MASGLANIGKKRALARMQEQAHKESTSGLAAIGKKRNTEKNQGGVGGGIEYVAGNLGLGLASVGEGAVDIVSAGADLLRGDTDMAKYRFLDNKTGKAQQRLQEDYNPGVIMKGVGDVASGMGTSLAFLLPYVGPYLAGAGFVGQGISNAAEKTGDVGLKEIGYGAVSGGLEFGMEALTAGMGSIAKNIGSSITRTVGREAAEAGAKATAKLAGKSFGKAVLTDALKGAAGEAIEEAATEAIDPGLLRLFHIDENAKLDWKNVAYAGLIGGLSGGLMTAGPAAVNYKSAVSTGKSIRESGETADFLEHARMVVKGAQRKEASIKKAAADKATAKTAAKTSPTAGSQETEGKAAKASTGLRELISTHKSAKAGKRVAQLSETVQKNLAAYEGYLNKADKTAKELEISDAILGEMRGNVFLLENAALLETYEEAILELSDEDKAVLVAEINRKAKASGAEKADYTVEDLNADTDGILSSVAANYLLDENYGKYVEGSTKSDEKASPTAERSPLPKGEGQEKATESPVEAARAEEAGEGEVSAPQTEAAVEEIRAAEAKQEAAPEAGAATQAKEETSQETAPETIDRADQKPTEKTKPTFETDFVEVRLPEGKQMRDLSPEAYGAYNAAKILGEALHAKIILHETLADVSGRKQNGYYDTKTHEIHVALDSGRGANGTALFTLAHEVTHYIEDWDYQKYSELEEFVKEQIGQTKMAELAQAKKEFMRTLDAYKDMDDFTLGWHVYDEVIADSMETVLSDGKVLEALAKRDKTLWEKIRDWVLDAIRRIKDVYAGLKPNSQAAKVLSETMTDMEKLERLFTEAAVAAGEKARNPETADPTFQKGVYAETDAKENSGIVYHLRDALQTLGEYDATRKRHIESSGKDRIVRTYDEIRAFIQDSPSQKKFERIHIGIINSETANLVMRKTKQDINGYDVVLSNEFIAHIFRDHGDQRKETPRHQIAVTTANVEDLVEAMIAPDDVKVVEADTGPALRFEKNVGNKNVALTITSKKKGTLTLKSAWIIENSGGRTPSTSADALVGTSETNGRSSTESSIAQGPDSVNRKYSISEENVSEGTESTDVSENAADTNGGGNGAMTWDEAFGRAKDERREREIQSRVVLADALLETALTEQEYRKAKQYKAKAEELADAEIRRSELRKKTAEINREIKVLEGRLTKIDTNRPAAEVEEAMKWVKNEIEEAKARKTSYLEEMDSLADKIRGETAKLLTMSATKPFEKEIREANKRADAMEKSAERARERELETIERTKTAIQQSKEREERTWERSKEWAANTVKKIRAEANERIAKAEQDAREYKTAIHKTSMDRVYKANREASEYKTAVYRKAYEKADEKNRKYKEKLDRLAGESRERGEITARKRTVSRVLGTLETKLYHPTKNNHVPQELQELAMTTLHAADPKAFSTNRKNLREIGELAGKIERLERKAARTANEQETLDKMKAKYEHLEAETIPLKQQAEALLTAFVEYNKKLPETLRYPDGLLNIMTNRVKEIESVSLSEMGLRSLEAVETFVTMLSQQVDTANQTLATERAMNIDQLSTKANREVANSKELKILSPTGKEWKAMTMIRKYLWWNMKPLTVFEAIGSETLQELFQGILDGEEVWARDVKEAEEFLTKVKKESGYNKWNMEQRSEVKTASGETVSLTLGEKLSLYAYMFRDQAEEHLSIGGFTFAPDATTIESFKKGAIKYEAVLNDQKQYKMRKEDIAVMAESLTPEQKKFAKDVQEYLTSLGKKGNEVSRQLYGIELFNEKYYFPIRSNRDYLAESTGRSGDPNIKSRGTFQETVPGAGNPIVLEDFMSVVTGHVNNMATYHAFVLPVEDFTRVWNYTPVNIKRDENGEAILDKNGMPIADEEAGRSYNSLKAEITKKYGKQANEYILQLIRDLNGGARRDAAASILDKGISSFKQATTMLSLSTIIQQPTSIFRAMAIIDGKYFSGAEMVDWEEIKDLAPVAFIKEMGGHDTSTGARTEEHLNAKQYDSVGDKVKAMLKPKAYGGDPHARAEAFGWLTGKADELAWRLMFGACLNEQSDKLGKAKNSKEVKEAAAKRFTEVVRKTQVYDSTLTRSEWMRSKDGLMKIVTSFSAEPTTVMSMMAEAIIKQQRGDKKAVRTIGGAVALSVMATAIASSLIYAMRDDDEDETFVEKYLQSLASETLEGINPLEYMPVARDVMSLFKGYEIERTDMTLVSNLFEQIELITSSKRSVPDKIFGVSGAISAFFGVPVTNVYRDAKGFANTILGFRGAETQTAAGFKHAVGDSVRNQFNLFAKLFGAESGNAYELYTAFVSGDTAHYNRVAARYESESAVEQALRRELRERDRRIGEAAEARIAGELDVYESIIEQIEGEGIFDRNIIIRAINNEINALKAEAEKGTTVPKDEEAAAEDADEVLSLYSATDLNDALERGDREDFSWIYQTLITSKKEQGKTEAQAKAAVKSSVTAYWKKRYIAAWEQNDTAEIKRIQSILLSTGLYGSRNDVAELGQGWVKAYAAAKK